MCLSLMCHWRRTWFARPSWLGNFDVGEEWMAKSPSLTMTMVVLRSFYFQRGDTPKYYNTPRSWICPKYVPTANSERSPQRLCGGSGTILARDCFSGDMNLAREPSFLPSNKIYQVSLSCAVTTIIMRRQRRGTWRVWWKSGRRLIGWLNPLIHSKSKGASFNFRKTPGAEYTSISTHHTRPNQV